MTKLLLSRLAACAAVMLFIAVSSAGGSMAGSRAAGPAGLHIVGQPLTAWPSPPAVHNAAAGPGWLSPQAHAVINLVYVADDNQVVIFPKGMRNAAPIGTITDGVTSAYGLFLDAEKNLYVCNQVENTVAVYPPGATSPSLRYTQGLHRPLYAVADTYRVFVGNADTGTIAIFEKGHDKLLATLKTFGTEVDGMAFGTAGYLYAAYRHPGGPGGIEKFPPGGIGKGVDLGISLNAPQGVVIDPLENVLAVETQGTDRVDFFLRGTTTPYETQTVPNIPTQIALGDLYQKLYISDLDDRVYQTSYEKFTPPIDWISNSLHFVVQGLAVSPPASH